MASDSTHNELVKLQLGCGLNAPLGWVNIDASFTARLSKWRVFYNVVCKIAHTEPVPWPKNIIIADVRKGITFPDGSVKAIYSAHMLEHLGFEAANFVIKECYRCLCKGGIIRMIVPDLYQISKKYIDLMTISPKVEHSQAFLHSLNLQKAPYKGVLKFAHKMLGHSQHQHMYDECSLREFLEKHGFKSIQKMDYRQSRITDISAIENKEGYEMSICLEGMKE